MAENIVYGQLIWDVPKIENIMKNDVQERKEKVVMRITEIDEEQIAR